MHIPGSTHTSHLQTLKCSKATEGVHSYAANLVHYETPAGHKHKSIQTPFTEQASCDFLHLPRTLFSLFTSIFLAYSFHLQVFKGSQASEGVPVKTGQLVASKSPERQKHDSIQTTSQRCNCPYNATSNNASSKTRVLSVPLHPCTHRQ